MLRQEYQDIRAALSAVDEVLKNISALDKASDEGELNRIRPALLASMGRYAAADRAYLFGWTDEKRLALHMTHEWCAPRGAAHHGRDAGPAHGGHAQLGPQAAPGGGHRL